MHVVLFDLNLDIWKCVIQSSLFQSSLKVAWYLNGKYLVITGSYLSNLYCHGLGAMQKPNATVIHHT